MSSKVSILIPAYNAARSLPDTLRSALAQTWPDFEIIVVDDGSTDETLAAAWSVTSPRIKVVRQENRGQAAAFNRALAEAQGDYFVFLDADDLLARDKIERQIARLHASGPEFVASGEWARFCGDSTEAVFRPERVWRDLAPVDWLVESWMGGGMMHGAAWLVPRGVAERAGPWNESLSLVNDLDYFPRVLLASRGVLFCPGARSYYRSGSSASLSASRTPDACISGFKALRLSRECLLQAEHSPRTRLACATALQRFIYWLYPDGREFIAEAEREVSRLGGSPLRPEGGRGFQLASSLLGWKAARHLQRIFWRLRKSPSCLSP